LSTDLDDPRAVPYFLWDDPMSVGELRDRLESASPDEKARLLGKIMREARDTDVWKFTKPQEVWDCWSDLELYLGRRKAFWKFLLTRWIEAGFIGTNR